MRSPTTRPSPARKRRSPYLDGVYYAVTVGEARPDAAASVQACRLLELRNGMALPHSRNRLDVTDPEMVIAAIQALTHVISVGNEWRRRSRMWTTPSL